MKCRRCKASAVIEVRRHNAAFCRECFVLVFRGQVERAIDEWDMLERGDRVLIAVSGGKDSLALWDVLLDLGYRVDGLYLGLGIGEYSDRSGIVTAAFAGSLVDWQSPELRCQSQRCGRRPTHRRCGG